MLRLHSRKSLKPTRSSLRQNMPAPEAILWAKLRNKQLGGFRFRRQHSVGRYIVDFYCATKKIALELDGDSHCSPDSIEYDRIRDDFLAACDITIIRFTNEDVRKNLSGVLEIILGHLQKPSTPTPPAAAGGTPPPTGGESDDPKNLSEEDRILAELKISQKEMEDGKGKILHSLADLD